MRFDVCASCFCTSVAVDAARGFACSRCGAAAVECPVCQRLARERELDTRNLCALCALADEHAREARRAAWEDCVFETNCSLLDDYAGLVDGDQLIVVLPVTRVQMDVEALRFPGHMHFYQHGIADLEALNIGSGGAALAATQSEASGVRPDVFSKNTVVTFPINVDWSEIHRSHASDLAIIRALSAHVDRTCLDLLRYLECPIDQMEALPARAGQLSTNPMMSAALLYNPKLRQARILGGAAFTHFLTRGLGLPLVTVAHARFPRDGEVGNIARHGLSLYAMMLEASSETSRFVQCLSLLEFLAFPDDYERFKKVKRVIARYVATSESEYQRILERFEQLTSKEDANGAQTGYRTCIVHLGRRIEDLIPDAAGRAALFVELQGYIKPVLDHMILHSHMSFDEYKVVQRGLAPFLGRADRLEEIDSRAEG